MDTKSIAPKYTLGKNERLKSRKLIGQLFSEGKSISAYPFRLLYLVSSGDQGLRAGFTVSSKHYKKAVDRNRIKRLMREAYRLNKHLLNKEGRNVTLFLIYTAREIMDFESVRTKMQEALSRLAAQIK